MINKKGEEMSNSLSQIKFSESKSQARIAKAQTIMRKAIVNRIIAFALFLLGANRDDIAHFLSMPKGTLLSLLTRLSKNGIQGLSDQRVRADKVLDRIETVSLVYEINCDNNICIKCGSLKSLLEISPEDKLHQKIILLTFMKNKLITGSMVAKTLGISKRQVGNLLNKFYKYGASALLDQRKGQTTDYVFTPEVKSEMILQFAINASCNGKTTGRAIATDLQDRTGLILPERSIRHYLSKLGLSGIAEKMKQIIGAQKKTQ
jgi:transposase